MGADKKSFCNEDRLIIFVLFRGVAQLVAYYVRDVGAGSSSLLTPTIIIKWPCKSNIYEAIFINSTKSSINLFRITLGLYTRRWVILCRISKYL
jgi:hypothetical protein